MPEAARITDPVGHGFALAGMLLGAVVGALLVAGTVASGGLLGAVIVAGGVAMGGLSGGKIASGLQRAMGVPNPTTGLLGVGAVNVLIGGLTAARAGIDSAVACNGLYGLNHFPIPMPLIAQGSKIVTINGMPAGRVGDKLVCGADITQGRFDVIIGGPTATVCMIIDAEAILRTGLVVLGWAALLVGAGLVGVVAGAAALGAGLGIGLAIAESVGAVIGFGGVVWLSGKALEGLHRLGDTFGPGYGDIFEGAGGLLLLWGGSKGLSKTLPEIPEVGAQPESRITEDGIQQIEQHLSRPELDALNDPSNSAMIQRLRAGNSTPQDLNFYNHELYEKSLMDQGMEAREAHLQTLQRQGIQYEPGYESQLYHQSVIKEFPENFNPACYPKD